MSGPQSDIPPLAIEGLSFQYQSRPEPALRDLTFSVRRGEILLIAGSSGSGKTTFIRCVNGLIPRSYRGNLQGSVLLHGANARSYSLAKLSQIVGTVLQDPEKQILGAHVLSEVAFGPENLGLPVEDIGDRVAEALARLGIEHLRDRDTFSLSGGEKQKAALAGCLSLRPLVIMAMILPFSFTTDPYLYGVTFRRLGLSDAVAFALDLALRYVPTIARDYFITVDAQRARGYELERRGAGLFNMIRRAAPLIVPVTINAIAGGEEVVDAMELRAFGVGPRTWSMAGALRFKTADYLVMGWAAATLVTLILLRYFTAYGSYWFPVSWFE